MNGAGLNGKRSHASITNPACSTRSGVRENVDVGRCPLGLLCLDGEESDHQSSDETPATIFAEGGSDLRNCAPQLHRVRIDQLDANRRDGRTVLGTRRRHAVFMSRSMRAMTSAPTRAARGST